MKLASITVAQDDYSLFATVAVTFAAGDKTFKVSEPFVVDGSVAGVVADLRTLANNIERMAAMTGANLSTPNEGQKP